jgi:hypothetical protein
VDRPLGFQEVEAPEFLYNRHMKVVRLSALRTGRLHPPPPEIFGWLVNTKIIQKYGSTVFQIVDFRCGLPEFFWVITQRNNPEDGRILILFWP